MSDVCTINPYAGDASTPYLEEQIKAELITKALLSILTRVNNWQLSLTPPSLDGSFTVQIPTEEWYLRKKTFYDEVTSEAEWEQVEER